MSIKVVKVENSVQGQHNWLFFDAEEDVLGIFEQGDSENTFPERVYKAHRWEIPSMTADRANTLLEEAETLCQKYLDAEEIEAEEEALDEISFLCSDLEEEAEAQTMDGQRVGLNAEFALCDFEKHFAKELKAYRRAWKAGKGEKCCEIEGKMNRELDELADDIVKGENSTCEGYCEDGEKTVREALAEIEKELEAEREEEEEESEA